MHLFAPPVPDQVVDGVLFDDATKSKEESVKLVEQWNSGTQEYPDQSCLHDMFRESASRNRDAIAIVFKVCAHQLSRKVCLPAWPFHLIYIENLTRSCINTPQWT